MTLINPETQLQRAQEIVGSLPSGPYENHYQPPYPDSQELETVIVKLLEASPATTISNVRALSATLAAVKLGETSRPVLISNNCTEPILEPDRLHVRVDEISKGLDVFARSALANAVHIFRYGGQTVKPRSSLMEKLPNGDSVLSHMGDGINARDVALRTPDPNRLVASAEQSARLEDQIAMRLGYHLFSAHEALSLPYEESFITEDPETGEKFDLSGDFLWAGYRTNKATGRHIDLLSKISNPAGVKLGPGTTKEHITALNQKLNPHNIPGGLILMPRLGRANMDQAQELLEGISELAPAALLVPDYVHGNTRITDAGIKTRSLPDIEEEIGLMYEAAAQVGVRIHGAHLETMVEESQTECIDEHGQEPSRASIVDPQLNPSQTHRVAAIIAQNHLLQVI